MAEEKLTFDEPHEKLTALASLAMDAIQDRIDAEGLRMVVFVVDPSYDPAHCGMGIHGYDGPALVFFDLLQQLKAMGNLMGTEVKIAPLGRG